jgi:hypothetical protein
MTNWCRNIFEVTGDVNEVARFKQAAVGYWPCVTPQPEEAPDVLNFHNLVPMPVELVKAGDTPQRSDWQKENWGCSGGAFSSRLDTDEPGYLLYLFETPNLPPLEWMKNASLRWPTLRLEMTFQEEMLSYRGDASACAGTLTTEVDTTFGDSIKAGEAEPSGDE